MVKVISTIKAILTRIIFSVHSFIAVWQVNYSKKNPIYWALCGPIAVLVLEGIFTLAIKKSQEWRWFCPSVFLYLGSVVPAIWLLEFEKINIRLAALENKFVNQTSLQPNLSQIFGDNIKIPNVDAQTWTTLIEQFLMLILIVGRWLLPKGDLTRDQLSQLLLVYIGTAADIIEFFDSYKDDAIAKIPLLVYLTLGIWSWSLLQFTIVLSATRSRRPRGGGTSNQDEGADCCNDCCCGIDVWGIALNVLLQDAPFLTFRLLIIVHFRIINYMNVFFTCKNSLVILLQLYRLYVVNSEYWRMKREQKRSKYRNQQKIKRKYDEEKEEKSQEIYIISEKPEKKKTKRVKEDSDEEFNRRSKQKKDREKYKKRIRKDTGYSTASSQNTTSRKRDDKTKHRKKDKKYRKKSSSSDSDSERETKRRKHRSDEKKKHRKSKRFDPVVEESFDSSDSSIRYEIINERHSKKKNRRKSSPSSSSSSSSSS